MFTSRVHCLNPCAQFRRVELGTTIRCRVVFGIGEEGDGLKSFAEALGRVISLCTVVIASQEMADSRWRLPHIRQIHIG